VFVVSLTSQQIRSYLLGHFGSGLTDHSNRLRPLDAAT
jgi:hypothetical protein